MKIVQTLYSVIILSAVQASPLQAQSNVSLAKQMDAQQFHAAGLDTLSAAQLANLDHWLSSHTRPLPVRVVPSQAHSARLAAAGGVVADKQGELVSADIADQTGSKPATAIDSQISGEFSGWGPGSIIVLNNGQRWRVIDDSRLDVGKPMHQPAVHIARSLFGSWTLRVKGYNTRARLEPVN